MAARTGDTGPDRGTGGTPISSRGVLMICGEPTHRGRINQVLARHYGAGTSIDSFDLIALPGLCHFFYLPDFLWGLVARLIFRFVRQYAECHNLYELCIVVSRRCSFYEGVEQQRIQQWNLDDARAFERLILGTRWSRNWGMRVTLLTEDVRP